MKPASARHRVDSTAKALTAEAERLGVRVVDLGGTIDAALYLGHVVRLVDWKGPQTDLKPSQAKLIARGCPIAFVSDVPQLQALVAQMRREAGIAVET